MPFRDRNDVAVERRKLLERRSDLLKARADAQRDHDSADDELAALLASARQGWSASERADGEDRTRRLEVERRRLATLEISISRELETLAARELELGSLQEQKLRTLMASSSPQGQRLRLLTSEALKTRSLWRNSPS